MKKTNSNQTKRQAREKHCNQCNGVGSLSLWQFPVNELGYVPAMKAGDGGYVNGRLVKVSCYSCSPFGSPPKVLYKGAGWRDLPDDEIASPEKSLTLREMETIPVLEG